MIESDLLPVVGRVAGGAVLLDDAGRELIAVDVGVAVGAAGREPEVGVVDAGALGAAHVLGAHQVGPVALVARERGVPAGESVPGELVVEALAAGALRVLRGDEKALDYPGGTPCPS